MNIEEFFNVKVLKQLLVNFILLVAFFFF